jgi:hypothetical protein
MKLNEVRRLKEQLLIEQELGLPRRGVKSVRFTQTTITVIVTSDKVGDRLPGTCRGRDVYYVVESV